MPQHDQLVPLHTVSSEVFKVSGGLKCRIKYRMCTKKEKKITVTISFMKEYTHCLENSKLQEFIYFIGVLCHGLCEKTCMYVCCIKKKQRDGKKRLNLQQVNLVAGPHINASSLAALKRV